MSKTLTYEQMMALFAQSHKETVELRESMAEETAKLQESISRLEVIVEKNSADLQKNNDRLDKISIDLQKNNDRLDKISADLQKNSADIQKNTEDLQKNNDRLDKISADLRKNSADIQKNTEDLQKNNHKIGLLTNKLGSIVESIVIPGIVGKFNEKGFGFDSVSTRVEFLNEERDGNLAEVDALLENGKFVIAVEAKTDMSVSDVNKHIKRLKALRGIPRFKGKKIYGALSTAVARKRPVNYALEQGFYVLQQPDVMGVRILDFPKGCRAKAW